MALLSRLFPSKKVRPEEFWFWFAGRAAEFGAADFERRPDLVEEIARRLRACDEGLAFQLSGRPGSDEHTIEISADGIREVAPRVRAFVAAAPPISGWRIEAFRQPVGDGFAVRTPGGRLDFESVRCVWRTNGGHVDVDLYIHGLGDANRDALGSCMFLLLDALLGEETVMERIGGIEMRSLVEAPAGHLPLLALRDAVG